MIKVVKYEDILPIWEERLWLERKDPVEPTSWMLHLDGYAEPKHAPTFFAWFDNDKIVGVNSGHLCADNSYRSRGLWVDEEYRGQGIASKLLMATIKQGKLEGAAFCWSFPRLSSWRTYERVGFQLTSQWSSNINNTNAYCKLDY